MVLGTALLRGCWGRAPGLQYGPEDRSRDLPPPHACTHCLSHPPPCLHSHPYPWPAPTPLLAPLSHAPACPPACCPVRGAQAASRCFRGGGGPCYVPAQRSRDAAAVAGANKGKVRLGGWVAAGTCRHPPRWHRCGGQARSGTVPMPRDGDLPPLHASVGEPKPRGLPAEACCSLVGTRVLSGRLCGYPPEGQQ